MAFSKVALGVSASCNLSGLHEERRPVLFSDLVQGLRVPKVSSPGASLGARRRRCEAQGRGRLKLAEETRTVENGHSRSSVDIPVSCYQILGIPNQAEKDEIVKSVMELRNAEIEDGYTLDAVIAREELLMDVRDKLLFEPEYAGNAREKVPPRASLHISWTWLPGALCLLQEVGEVKLVLEMGRAALQRPDAKPYVHDLLLSMALAECSIAKHAFEMGKVSQGFEALARGQYLLRSKTSLENLPLLNQIEESLEELAPACTLELLSLPHTPENAERRRGAIAALRELLRQGLEVETSCRVRDWPCFLGQAMTKLMATEIVDLLSWDVLAVTRKNKKSLESQNQRVVIDFNCFYIALLAHIALGFSTKQMDLINKSKTMCECLEAFEGINLKFEESLCALLLGLGSEKVVAENFQLLESNQNPSSQKVETGHKEAEDGKNIYPSLEKWLKNSALGLFTDTKDCSPSLAEFFGGEKKNYIIGRQKKRTEHASTSVSQKSSFVLPPPHKLGASEDSFQKIDSTRHLGSATRQLAPSSLQSQLLGDSVHSGASPLPMQMNRNIDLSQEKAWESWWAVGESKGRLTVAALVLCVVFTTFKMFHVRLGQKNGTPLKLSTTAFAWTADGASDSVVRATKPSIFGRMTELFAVFKNQLHPRSHSLTNKSMWPADDLLALIKPPTSTGGMLHRRQMSLEEAETLVKQWQTIKAEALGPHHHLQSLPDILCDSMLDQWQALAETAMSSSCFWRFLLLQLSILRADILSDGAGWEMAEIDAILEEAAELVDESLPKNPNYYSTYQIRYVLKRQNDGSWRFCGCGIQTPG
ncbi:plastid division protein CDP1, chloroplastic [Nymphaea colorata]|nr:plastid division protein CDP1, chloroplastic [Nymphaea colorata]XP_031475174.1 plastid division protein CDP1, chloroplastic [Nymphaea colorata]